MYINNHDNTRQVNMCLSMQSYANTTPFTSWTGEFVDGASSIPIGTLQQSIGRWSCSTDSGGRLWWLGESLILQATALLIMLDIKTDQRHTCNNVQGSAGG